MQTRREAHECGGSDLVARMIAAQPAARRCSDAAEEIFPLDDATAPGDQAGTASTYDEPPRSELPHSE